MAKNKKVTTVRKRGRPRSEDPLVTKALRLRQSHLKLYDRAASVAGLSLSAWIRDTLDRAAAKKG